MTYGTNGKSRKITICQYQASPGSSRNVNMIAHDVKNNGKILVYLLWRKCDGLAGFGYIYVIKNPDKIKRSETPVTPLPKIISPNHLGMTCQKYPELICVRTTNTIAKPRIPSNA